MKFLDLAGVERFKQYTDNTFVTTEDVSEIDSVVRDTYTKQEIDEMLNDIESGGSDVSKIKIGDIMYNPSNGIVSLPAYPTTLPASDVPSWAKSNSKPTYTASEVGALPDTTVIPDAITESTVSGWGFTKNTGTLTSETDPVFTASAAYGISSNDISNWNAKTSNTGTITGITMNGSSKGTSGVVDLGTVLTAHQDISGKASLSGAAFTGAVTGTSSGNTSQFRNITISSSEPTSSQGSNGDIWIVV